MRNFTIIHLLVLVFLTFTETVNAQIGKPNLGFSQACANSSFNEFYITFTFTPSSLGPNNQFIIELSDASGSFTNGTAVFTSSPGTVTVSPATLGFSLPTSTAGENYKVRVKGTDPVATSSNSDAFAAYYKIQDSPFTINNLVSTAVYCSGSSYLLTIDNPGDSSNDSPLQYPSLTFNWYKETSPTTSVFVSSGNSLSVNQPGTYYVETNYGTCTSNSFSNRVTVNEASSQNAASINSSLGNPYCSADGPTTLNTINGNSYQWFKNGEAISGATNQTYQTNESGTFSVNIDLGTCSTSASINLDNTPFTSSIDVSDTNTIEEGETLVVTVTTTANSPQYEWYLNGSLVSGAVGNSYDVTQIGDYRVVVTQTGGCMASEEFLFKVQTTFPDVADIPNLISPNGDGINDTWMIPKVYVSGTNTQVMLFNAQGELVFQTTDYQNDWPQNQLDLKNVNLVYYYIITTQDNKTKKGSITVIK